MAVSLRVFTGVVLLVVIAYTNEGNPIPMFTKARKGLHLNWSIRFLTKKPRKCFCITMAAASSRPRASSAALQQWLSCVLSYACLSSCTACKWNSAASAHLCACQKRMPGPLVELLHDILRQGLECQHFECSAQLAFHPADPSVLHVSKTS